MKKEFKPKAARIILVAMETPTSYLALFELSIFALFWDTLLRYIVSYWWVQWILLYIS